MFRFGLFVFFRLVDSRLTSNSPCNWRKTLNLSGPPASSSYILGFIMFYEALGIEPRTLYILGKYSTC